MCRIYKTTLTKDLTEKIVEHIDRLRPNIVKLAIASDPGSLRQLQRALKKKTSLWTGVLYFSADMEEEKTRPVSD